MDVSTLARELRSHSNHSLYRSLARAAFLKRTFQISSKIETKITGPFWNISFCTSTKSSRLKSRFRGLGIIHRIRDSRESRRFLEASEHKSEKLGAYQIVKLSAKTLIGHT
jgi:hypothetical protein